MATLPASFALLDNSFRRRIAQYRASAGRFACVAQQIFAPAVAGEFFGGDADRGCFEKINVRFLQTAALSRLESMTTDWQELQRYASDGSEEAFQALVDRHIGLVYSAALRQTADEQLAKDITQMVFANLARRAKCLKPVGTLAGWLHRDTRFTALELLRQNRRRVAREREAAAMHQAGSTMDAPLEWSRIHPALDAALEQLGRVDRDALLLRFFEKQSLQDIGAALNMEEDTARKRVSRAIEKLRAVLSRQGIHTSAEMLSSSLSAQLIHPIPAGLAAIVAGSAIAAGGTAAAALTTLTFIQGISMTKLQASVAAVIIAAGVSAPLLIQRAGIQNLRNENAALRLQAERAGRPKTQNEELGATGSEKSLSGAELSELLRLRGEVGLLRQQTNELTLALQRAAERSRAVRNSLGTPEPQQAQPDIASARAVIFDPNATLRGKLEALRHLRDADARSDDVVRQMIQIYYGTTDLDARSDIFRQLHGTTVADLKRPLLEAVSNPNEHPEVKEEAAETLDGFLSDPDARAWLEHLAQNDANAKVREQASKSLRRSLAPENVRR